MRGHIRKYEGKTGTSWMVQYYLGYDEMGKKKRSTKRGFKTKKEAEAYLANITKGLYEGTYVDPSRRPFSEYLDQWLDYKREFVRPKTIDIYKRTLRLHITRRLGRIPLCDLKPMHLRDLYTALQRHSGLSARYVSQIHNMLHDVFDRAVKWELVHRNIADAVDAPKPVRQKFNVWTIEEARRFLSSPLVTSHRFHVAFLLALTTGMRQGELLGLRWSDIDLDKGLLRIKHSLTFLDGKFVFGPPKSESGERTITLMPQVIRALRQHRAQQNERRVFFGPGYINHDLVVCRMNGNFVSQSFLRKNFTDLIDREGMPYIRFHDLRHTHASILLELGEELKVIQEQLGHANISITADTYTHVSDNLRSRPAELLSNAFFGPTE